ncbi:MAG: hypothetical protein KJ063_21620 [Anaerolineae bacterium]|nr:hypothetical protein [Anaerolineae bacterium]
MTPKRLLFVGLTLIVISCALLGILAFISGSFGHHDQLAYIEKTTGLTFPAQLSQVDVFDNGEFYVTAHIKLRDEDSLAFINQYGFDKTPTMILTPWIMMLKPENRIMPTNANVWYQEGRTASNRWECIIDQDSGRLWIVIFYPDSSGALP